MAMLGQQQCPAYKRSHVTTTSVASVRDAGPLRCSHTSCLPAHEAHNMRQMNSLAGGVVLLLVSCSGRELGTAILNCNPARLQAIPTGGVQTLLLVCR